ncbi:MAG TPA: T9SS type A sorting domain-containing protein, partial [Bacteroidota bacterium]
RITVRAYQQTGGAAIDSVRLFYRFNSSAFVAKQMTTPGTDSTWSAVIPPAPDSTFVRYYMRAYDHAGKVTPLVSYSSSSGTDTSTGFFFYESMNRAFTIRDIQYTPFSNGYSPYAADTVTSGATVTVSGIVTADTSDIYLNGNPASTVGGVYPWYMQSTNAPWSGIWIVGDSTMYKLHRGDSVTVTGRVEEWSSFSQRVTTRISGITGPIVRTSGNPIPAAVSKATSVFGSSVASGNVNAEPYEGMLVKFTNPKVTNLAPYFSDATWYEINDGTGAVWVHRDGRNSYTNIAADTSTHPTWKVLKVGDKISTLTGILHFSVNRYKLVPRTDADFGTITGIGGFAGGALPVKYALEQNYPNPFNPSTVIGFRMPAAGIVSLKVYNILGQEVNTLMDGMQPAGNYSVRFEGAGLSTGVYFYRLQAGSFVQVRKMMLLK